jgi:hypothetical protein
MRKTLKTQAANVVVQSAAVTAFATRLGVASLASLSDLAAALQHHEARMADMQATANVGLTAFALAYSRLKDVSIEAGLNEAANLFVDRVTSDYLKVCKSRARAAIEFGTVDSHVVKLYPFAASLETDIIAEVFEVVSQIDFNAAASARKAANAAAGKKTGGAPKKEQAPAPEQEQAPAPVAAILSEEMALAKAIERMGANNDIAGLNRLAAQIADAQAAIVTRLTAPAPVAKTKGPRKAKAKAPVTEKVAA